MKRRARKLWSVGAKVLACAIAACAVWWMGELVRQVSRAARGDPEHRVIAALLILVSAVMILSLLWIAWRLWRHWSAGTVRMITGVGTGVAALYLLSVAENRLGDGAHRDWMWNLAGTLLLILGAVVYRKTSRAVIRWADLADPRDAHGHPVGHMQRVRAFCIALGVSVWLSGSALSPAMRNSGLDDAGAIGVFGSMLMGWATYAITLWWMTPPTQPALPPGRGFEVLPPEQRRI